MVAEKHIWPGWETVRLIGRGSFGAVYEIERKLFDDDEETEKAALKVISIPQNDSDIEELYNDGYDEESVTSTFHTHLKSIVAEYSLMRKMNGSSNIVNCDDVRYVQHDDGIGWDIYIKMELLTPLAKALPATVSEEQVIKIAKDMCAALELCQKHNIIHRDIKPQNIFVSENGDYKLGDFGIAKTVEKTMGGTKTGTYKYMAPEVYSNRPYNSTADIYSLGLVLYWLLNERRMPFMPLPPEKLRAGMDEESRNRRFSGEKIPAPKNGSEELKRIVLKACAFDPKDRYQSAREMREDLMRLSGHEADVQSIQKPVQDIDITDDVTVGPAFVRNVTTEAGEQDKTVGPGFNHAPVVDATELDKTVGPKFIQNNKNDKSEQKREKTPKKKTKIVVIIIAICILLGATALAFVNGTSISRGYSLEKISAINWINEIEEYRATHKTYELSELINLTEGLTEDELYCYESIVIDNAIIRKYRSDTYVTIRVIYLDPVGDDCVYADEFTYTVVKDRNLDDETYSRWVRKDYYETIQTVKSTSGRKYHWLYVDIPKLGPAYHTAYVSEYIDGYATECFISKEFFAEGEYFANERMGANIDLDLPRDIDTVASGVLTVAVSPDFPPMAFVDSTKNGQDMYVGFEPTLAHYIADELGLELVIMPMSFDACQTAVYAGTVDMAISGFRWTEERAENYNLSDYYHAGDAGDAQILITLASNGNKYTTAEDLASVKIGAQNASLQQSLTEDQLPDNELVLNADLGTLVQQLKNGEFDCLAVSAHVGETIIAANPEITKTGFSFYVDPKHTGSVILLQKGADDLTNVINQILAESEQYWDIWFAEALSVYRTFQ